MNDEVRHSILINEQPAKWAYELLKQLNNELLKLDCAQRFTLTLGDISFFKNHQCFLVDLYGALQVLLELFILHKFPADEWLNDQSSCQNRLKEMYFGQDNNIIERKKIKKTLSAPCGSLETSISTLSSKQDIQLASLYAHYCRESNILIFSHSIWEAYVRLSKFCRIDYNETKFEELSYIDYCKSIGGLINNIQEEVNEKEEYVINNDILQHILIMLAPVATLDFVEDYDSWDINTSRYYRDNYKEIYFPIVELYHQINSESLILNK